MAKLWENLLIGLGMMIAIAISIGVGLGFYYLLFVIAKKVFLGD